VIDIGANLADRAFDGDRDAVIERALSAGVEAIIVTGTGVAESRRSLEVARTRPGVLFATAGVHPHHAKDCDDATIDALRELAAEPEVVAIGETGLDHYRDLSPRPVQAEWFEAQLALAAELTMPVFLHEREASDAFLPIVTRWRDRLPAVVVHCFTGSREALHGYLDVDLHVGITGWICDERRGYGLRQIVRDIPDHRLLIETDAPYLIPRTLSPKPRTRRNEPCWLGEVRDHVAQCRDQSPDHVTETTTANARRMFGI
jgi:TatD DNase family protein